MNKIKNKDLVELGFPDIITKSTYGWYALNWHSNNTDYLVVCDFYNTLYVLSKLYEKYTSKKVEVKKEEYKVYLNNEKVFGCSASRNHIYKHQNLEGIKKIVEELLEKIDFENLKKEFKEIYEKEKEKIELKEKEINEKEKFIEVLKNNKELLEKEIIYLKKPRCFGENSEVEKSNLKLKDILKREINEIKIYQNFLIFETSAKVYAIELNENEKQKIFEILTLLKI